MTTEPVALDDLLEARAALVASIVGKMPDRHRRFLITFEKGAPEWDLLGLPKIDKLPAVQWRQQNLDKITKNNAASRSRAGRGPPGGGQEPRLRPALRRDDREAQARARAQAQGRGHRVRRRPQHRPLRVVHREAHAVPLGEHPGGEVHLDREGELLARHQGLRVLVRLAVGAVLARLGHQGHRAVGGHVAQADEPLGERRVGRDLEEGLGQAQDLQRPP